LSGNISELVVVAVVSVINLHFQLFPLQILYINIVTDVLPALALGFTGGSDSIMKFPPRNIEEPIIDKKRWQAIISYSLIISIASLGAVFMSHFMVHNGEVWNHELFNNVLFFTLIIAQLVHVFNMGNEGVLFFKTDVFRNKYIGYATFASAAILILSHVIAPVRAALNIYPLSIKDWMVIIGMSLLSLILIQILRALKFIRQ
jgi:Ca2+-transporting ATPase